MSQITDALDTFHAAEADLGNKVNALAIAAQSVATANDALTAAQETFTQTQSVLGSIETDVDAAQAVQVQAYADYIAAVKAAEPLPTP